MIQGDQFKPTAMVITYNVIQSYSEVYLVYACMYEQCVSIYSVHLK